MVLSKNAWLTGLRYKGGSPMITWILHRIGGLAMVVFVGFHITSAFFTQQLGSNLAILINSIYESPYFQIVLYFFVIFHAINGLRIIIMDTFPKLLEYQRELTWLEWIIFIPIYGLAVFITLMRLFANG
ncbi:MAG: hypothetical protein ACPL4H_03585 [Anaerolineales bacterium]